MKQLINLNQIIEALTLTIELFLSGDKSIEDGVKWFFKPQEFLFKKSPFEVCLIGEGENLIQWLKNRLNKSEEVL